MTGNFPNLSNSTVSGWPAASDDPETRGWYPPYALTLTTVASVVVGTRIASQVKRNGCGFSVDDILICLALVFVILYTVATASGTLAYGFNRHIWDVPWASYKSAALVEWLSIGTFTFSACLAKISVLCFYRRVKWRCTTTLKILIWSLISFTIMYSLALLVAQALLCQPTSAYWAIPTLEHPVQRSCSSQHVVYILHGSLDIVSTVYCILVPALVFRNIPMSSFQRKGLQMILIASLLVLAAAIIREIYLYRLTHNSSGDATWNTYDVFVWSQAECSLLLILVSAPFLGPYFPQYPKSTISPVALSPSPSPSSSKDTISSLVTQINTTLSSRLKTHLYGASNNATHIPNISKPIPMSQPQASEIPEWEFATLDFSAQTRPAADLDQSYHRYRLGMYGPPAPPKDARELFDQWRREHGENV